MRKIIRRYWPIALLFLWLLYRPAAKEPVTLAPIIDDDDDYDVKESFSELTSRLTRLVEAPISTIEEALKSNYANCNKKIHDLQVNPDQYQNEATFWAHVSDEDIQQRRRDILQYIKAREVNEVIANPQVGNGRGIVMTAGNRVRPEPARSSYS